MALKRFFLVAIVTIVILGLRSETTTNAAGQAPQRGAPSSQTTPPPRQAPSSVRPLQPIDGVVANSTGQFTINDPRPLARAAELIERKFGVPISYEESLWMSPGDIVRAADLPQNRAVVAQNPGWQGPLGPRSSSIDLSIPVTEAERQQSGAPKIIQAAIDNHRAHRNPGDFSYTQLNDGSFVIVCERVDDAKGQSVPCVRPLDFRISFPEKERTISETLDVLVQSINATGKLRLNRPTMGGRGYFDGVRVRVGAQNEVARDVLARILKRTGGPRFAWEISTMPDPPVYLLGFRRVGMEITVPGVGPRLVELQWPNQ
jgi:hypothetical protein